MDSRKIKKLVLNNLAYVIFGYAGNIICFAFRTAEGKDISENILPALNNLGTAFAHIIPSFHPVDLLVGFAVGVAMKFIMKMRAANKKKFRQGTEYGSAVWGTEKDIAPYMDFKDKDNNVILTQTEGLTMGKPSSPKYARNKNILVIGGSGSGKTRFFVKPNLMQMHSSYIVTDPKGTVLIECGKMLERGRPVRDEKGNVSYQPYRIKVFNTIDFGKSMHYNPFAYISKKNREKDILKFVDVLIKNTQSSQQNGGDDFWVKAEKLLYTAYIAMIFTINPPEEQNFETLIEMINSSECREDDETFQNAIDRLFAFIECWINDDFPNDMEISSEFQEMKANQPNEEQKRLGAFACKQYHAYKLAAGKTAKSILISCASRLAPFDIKEVREITMYDELDLDMLGDERTALFLIMSDTDGTFAFLISLIYSILFNRLCERADDVYGGRLPIHVRCLIDEAANIGQIPNLERLMATIRSREISACLVLQAQSQLKALYKDNMDTIIGNCDASLFLGGKEETTLKSWNSLLGKETIDLYNTSVTKGNQESHGQNFQKLGKDLMSVDELAVMDGGKCLLQIRGVRSFLSRKYDITKHPNYKLLSDFNEKNAFNIEKFLSTRMPMRPGERYRNYEVTAEDLASQTL